MQIARNQFSPLRVHLGVKNLNLVYVRRFDFCLKVDWNFFNPESTLPACLKTQSQCSLIVYGGESQFDDSTYCWLREEAVFQHGESNFMPRFRIQISEKIVKQLRK